MVNTIFVLVASHKNALLKQHCIKSHIPREDKLKK